MLLWCFPILLVNVSLSLLRIWKLWVHMPKISFALISFIHSSTSFIPALVFKLTDLPLVFEHSLLFNKEKKFSTGANCGEYWGRKSTTWKFLTRYSIVVFAEWELALSNKITILLFRIFHFVLINFFKSTKNWINLAELIEFDWRCEKLQPSVEMPEIIEIDVVKVMLFNSALSPLRLQDLWGCVSLEKIHSSMLITMSSALTVFKNLILWMALFSSNISDFKLAGRWE